VLRLYLVAHVHLISCERVREREREREGGGERERERERGAKEDRKRGSLGENVLMLAYILKTRRSHADVIP